MESFHLLFYGFTVLFTWKTLLLMLLGLSLGIFVGVSVYRAGLQPKSQRGHVSRSVTSVTMCCDATAGRADVLLSSQ